MAYGDFKDLKRRAVSDKILRDKVFNIAKNPKYDGYQRGLAVSGVNIPLEFNELAKELHNQLSENFKKEKFILDLKIIFGMLI